MPLTLERKEGAWLDRHAHQWVEAGFVSADQIEAILAYEHAGESAEPQRLTVVAEVASYLGALVAFAGGAAIIGPNWDRLGLAGQGAVALAIAVVGLVGGSWLVRQGEAGMTRLGTFLWVVGTGGVALAVAGVVNEVDPSNDAWYPTLIGLPVLVIGAGLWRNLDRPLQLVTAALGAGLTGGGLAALTELSTWVVSPVVWSVSLVVGVLAASGRIHPRLVALIVASVGLMIGSFSLMDESERLGSIAAVASATLIVVFALWDRSWPLVGVGLIAFFIAITSLMQTVLHGMLARLIAVLFGLVVVAAVGVRAQRSSRADTNRTGEPERTPSG